MSKSKVLSLNGQLHEQGFQGVAIVSYKNLIRDLTSRLGLVVDRTYVDALIIPADVALAGTGMIPAFRGLEDQMAHIIYAKFKEGYYPRAGETINLKPQEFAQIGGEETFLEYLSKFDTVLPQFENTQAGEIILHNQLIDLNYSIVDTASFKELPEKVVTHLAHFADNHYFNIKIIHAPVAIKNSTMPDILENEHIIYAQVSKEYEEQRNQDSEGIALGREFMNFEKQKDAYLPFFRKIK